MQLSEGSSGFEFRYIGPLVYRSLWSEMLDDRKFYFPITVAKLGVQSQRHQGGFPGMGLRKWRSVGPADAVTMDEEQPSAGKQSPRIALNESGPRGIRQSGLAVVKGKQYIGHIWLNGTPGGWAGSGRGTGFPQNSGSPSFFWTMGAIPASRAWLRS